jgi:hypothetical protein
MTALPVRVDTTLSAEAVVWLQFKVKVTEGIIYLNTSVTLRDHI